MPANPLTFRAACGSFASVFVSFMAKRERQTVAMRVRVLTAKNRTSGVMFGVLLVLLFYGDLLLRCGDIEENPGPGPGRQTRLTSAGKISDDNSTPSSPRQPPTTEKTESSIAEVLRILASMQADVKETKEVCKALRDEISLLKGEMQELRNENASLKKDYATLSEKLESMERRNDDLENRSRRSNVIIHGIPRDDKEKTWEDCEARVKDMFKSKLKLPGEYPFDRVHRLSGKKDSPIIAKFTFFKDKEEVFKARGNLKGTNIFMGEDFSQRVRDIRKKLTPHLKDAKSAGKRATMVFDHLIIEGQKFFLDGDGKLSKLR